jgi:hypothetical protein
MRNAALSLVTLSCLAGCSSSPSADDHGSSVAWISDLFVDEASDAMVLITSGEGDAHALYAADPDTGAVTHIADLSRALDVDSKPHVVFTTGGILVVNAFGAPHAAGMALYDRATFQEKARQPAGGDVAPSPSRRWVLTATSVVDGDDLSVHPLPGKVAAAAWMHATDELVAVVGDSAMGAPLLRVVSWSMSDIAAAGFALDANGLWPAPHLDVSLGKSGIEYVSGSSLSPDDRWLAFSAKLNGEAASSYAQVPVVDLTKGTAGSVPSANVPLFTPDSATFVARDEKSSKILVIDPLTLTPTVVDTASSVDVLDPQLIGGAGVLVGKAPDTSDLWLYDLAQRTSAPIEGPALYPSEAAIRPDEHQIWFTYPAGLPDVSPGLYVLETSVPAIRAVWPGDEGYALDAVRRLPQHGWLVVAEKWSPAGERKGDVRLSLFDPVTEKPVRAFRLPE